MNLLFYEWGSYMYQDMADIFQKKGIRFQTFRYYLPDKNRDEKFETLLAGELKKNHFDAVFSINYFPVVAKVCYQLSIRYISWSYDNPLNVQNIEETLDYPTNRVYLFDRLQAKKYQDAGFAYIFHLPLAVNTERLDKIKPAVKTDGESQAGAAKTKRCGGEISFVGNLYPSALLLYTSQMNAYQKGYIEGICKVQQQIYGYFLIDEMLTDEFMESVQKQYRSINPNTEFVLPKEALSYAMAADVTRKERLALLSLLSNHHEVVLYSRDACDFLQKVIRGGTCDYFTEMPVVFKSSKINLNITLKCLQSGIPLRALDIMGCGGFLLSNYQEELAEYFVAGQDLVLYDSLTDAYEKAEFYLKQDAARDKIAKNGYHIVKQNFNYEKRLKELFRELI